MEEATDWMVPLVAGTKRVLPVSEGLAVISSKYVSKKDGLKGTKEESFHQLSPNLAVVGLGILCFKKDMHIKHSAWQLIAVLTQSCHWVPFTGRTPHFYYIRGTVWHCWDFRDNIVFFPPSSSLPSPFPAPPQKKSLNLTRTVHFTVITREHKTKPIQRYNAYECPNALKIGFTFCWKETD